MSAPPANRVSSMASAAYSEELTCLVCRTFFTDPVTLPCGHCFCRECVALSGPRCPQCEAAVLTEAGRSLPTSLTLKRLAEKAAGAGDRVAELCPEHEEKFKLFCVTEQLLTCIVCRDEERHDGHKFKTVKEAAASLRRELEEDVESLHCDIAATESLANTQKALMAKTKEKSQELEKQIRRQFEEMHQFLRKRENEVKNELHCQEQATVEGMRASLNSMETALSESRESEAELMALLQIEDSEGLLRSWTRGNSGTAPERSFRPRANNLQVVDTSLSLGSYESHLQFFVWKEMLQVIQPRAELLSLKSTSADITVSEDGRSLFCTPKSKQAPSGYSSNFGSVPVSSQNTSSFGFTPVSSQNTSSFGFTPVSAKNTSSFGFPPVSAKHTSSFGFPPVSSQNTSSFGFPPVSAKNTSSFGFPPVSAKNTSSFGFPPVSSQNTSSFGFPPVSAKNTSSFGFPPVSAKNTSSFGFPPVSSQNTSSFGFPPVSAKNTSSFGFPPVSAKNTSSFGFPASSIKRHVFSVNEFTSGQHYWEIEVGHRDYWALGIKDHFLKCDGQKYSGCSPKTTTNLQLGARPRKIGIFLNCSSRKLSFYDADNMIRIHTLSFGPMSTPLSAYFDIRVTTPDPNPLTVCWY